MRFKIPQDVQMEDKIVGPLTLKQLIIVGIGGGIDYFLYTSLSQVYLLEVWLLPVIVIGLLTAAIAFLKIRGLKFTEYVLYSLEFYFKPRKRVWNQGGGEVFTSITTPKVKSKADKAKEKQLKKAPKDTSKINDISALLDKHSEINNIINHQT